MINFYHRFLKGVARILQPLTAALAGNPKVLTWLPNMSAAFATAKSALMAAVSLAHLLPGRSSSWRRMTPTPMLEQSPSSK
jgi:hypothetical protein